MSVAVDRTKVWLAVYRKFVVALIGFLSVLGIGLSDGALSSQEIIVSVVAGLTALGVRQTPNDYEADDNVRF